MAAVTSSSIRPSFGPITGALKKITRLLLLLLLPLLLPLLQQSSLVSAETTFTVIGDGSIPADLLEEMIPEGRPFRFTYIFIIGGICGDDVYATSDWYSQWAQAGDETIQNITEIICAPRDKYKNPYTRKFHEDALNKVENLVGNRLDETLVITVGVGLEDDWTPVANLMKRGMAFFHAKEDEHNFFIEDYGLSPQTSLYFYFQFNEKAAARTVGHELCRQYKGTQQLKIAKINVDGRNNSLNFRIDDALDVFQEECEETDIIDLWDIDLRDNPSGEEDWQQVETLLKFNRVPDLVLTGRDSQAAFFLDVAKKVLTPNKYGRIRTTGWNYNEDYRYLVDDCKIATTVDQEVLYGNRGLWDKINTVVELVEENGLRTSEQVKEKLQLKSDVVIQSDTTMITCDEIGYLLNVLLEGSYDDKAAPKTKVTVMSGLYDVSITQMIPFEGKFEANFWLRLEWTDPRLEWNVVTYNGSLPIDPELIWTPATYYNNQNDIEEAVLYQAPAMATHDGTVVLNTHSNIEFLCPTTKGLRAFPFDSYTCSIQLGSPYGVDLVADGYFEIIREEPNFQTTHSISYEPPEEHNQDEKAQHMGEEEIIYYELVFLRKPFQAWVRFIIPAVLINIVGFTSFWISEPEESVALGVTSLLCVLAFRETVDLPETSDVNWAEVFLGVNLIYQTMVMFIIFCSYGRFRGVAKSVDRFFRPLHPQEIKTTIKKKVLSASSGAEERIRLATEIPANDMVDPRCSVAQLHASSRVYNSASSHCASTSTAHLNMGSNSDRLRLSTSTFHNDTTHSQFTSSNHSNGWNGAPPPRLEKLREDSAVDIGNFSAGDENNNSLLKNSIQSSRSKHAEGFNDEEAESKQTNIITEEDTLEHAVNVDDFNRRESIEKSYKNMMKTKATNAVAEVFDRDGDKVNVDWVGRVFIVPSYIIVMLTLIITKWGLT